MPLFEFKCECTHEFESVQKMDTTETPCPKCGKSAKKVVSKPSPFRWGRGGGWNG
jgi:putative FmdB family regulatory protein